MKSAAAALALFVALAAAGLLARAAMYTSRQLVVSPAKPLPLDENALAARLGEAIRIRTISRQGDVQSYAETAPAFHALLERTYPRLDEKLRRELVDNHSLLYTWQGTDPALGPLVMLAHMDVVPVEEGSEASWEHPPFEGRFAGGFVWGRGALDDKSGVMAAAEAVEALLQEGFAPKRTVHLAFGHDEEVLGGGAHAIAQLLRSRGIKPYMVTDEGLAITQGIMPGVPAPVGLVGIAQKGYVTVELVVQGEGGHSSWPPAETAVGTLAAAVHRLESEQMPDEVTGAAQAMFGYVGPEMDFGRRLVFGNMWLFGPVVRRILLGKPSTAALLRTTTAPTMLEGSPKENVLATRARAIVNFRISPADNVAAVLEHVRSVVSDERVAVNVVGVPVEPSPIAPIDSETFTAVQRSLREVDPDVVMAPGLVIGATDARHYEAMTRDIYRFRPYRLRQEDLSRVHGINERIAVSDLVRMVRFNAQLIRNVAQ